MPRPVLTATFKQTRVTTTQQTYAHTGGHVLVFIWVATSGSNTPTNTCTINGVAATMIVDRALTGSFNGRWRVYASTAAIGASTVTIIIGAGTQLDHYGGVYHASITDWDGTLGTLDGSNLASDAFSSPRNVVHAGPLDCVVGCWGVRQLITTSTGTITASTATSQIAQGGGATGLASQDPASVRSILVQPTTQPTSAGTAALAVTQASWGANVAWNSFGIAFHGLPDEPPGNPPVLAAGNKGFSGDLATQASTGFNYVHTGGAVLVSLHVGEGASGSGCTVNGQSCGAAIASHFIAPASVINVWASPRELPAGTYNVTVAGASGRGEIAVCSITNWTRGVTSSTKPASSSFTASMVVSGITGDDLVVGWWGFVRNPWISASLVSGAGQTDVNGLSASNGTDWSSFIGLSKKNLRATPSATIAATTSYGSPTWVAMALALRGGAFVPISVLSQVSVEGSVTFSGATDRVALLQRSGGGNLSFSGATDRVAKLQRSGGGNLSFSGAFARVASLSRAMTGALSFSGLLATFRPLARVMTGTLSFSGLTEALGAIEQAVSGALSFAGSVATMVSKRLTGALSFAGAISTSALFRRAVSGALSFAGTMVRLVQRSLTGALSFAGDVARRLSLHRLLTGALSFTGLLSVARLRRVLMDAVLTFQGLLQATFLGPKRLAWVFGEVLGFPRVRGDIEGRQAVSGTLHGMARVTGEPLGQSQVHGPVDLITHNPDDA